MATDTLQPSSNRPYPPPSSVAALLARLRSRNLPERIDAEYLRDAGIPDSLNARTLFGLRFLGLVDHDVPSAGLRSIAKSTDEEYKQLLQGVIRAAYQDVFEVIDPAQDSQDRIVNFFRRYTPASQRDRMVVFFLGMCREAGIETLDVPKNRPSSVATGSKLKQNNSPKSTNRTGERTPEHAAKGRAGSSSKHDPGRLGTGDLHPSLELLVRSLPPPGKPFPEDRRRQWLRMAEAALDFVYPPGGIDISEGQEEEEEA